VPQKVAPERDVGVARVVDPAQTVVSRIGVQAGPWHLKEGPQQWRTRPHANHRHARQPRDAASTQRIEQHRFGLVVAMMAKEDGVGIDAGKRC
jgi:hypothetical protein